MTNISKKTRSNKLYRVQSSLDGRGPFVPGFSHMWVEERKDHGNLLPWFLEFQDLEPRLIFPEVAFGAACRTKTQLQRWFSKSEYQTLLCLGYHAVEIDYTRVLGESDIQTIFTRERPLCANVTPFELYPHDHRLKKFQNVHDRVVFV